MYCDQLPSSNLSSFLNFVKSHWNRSSFTEHMHLSANWHFPSSQFYVRNHEGFPPTTAKLLGGIGRQWQGISASHRWVGERIQPRGWPQMSANSQIWHFFLGSYQKYLDCGCLCCKARKLFDPKYMEHVIFSHSCLFGDRCVKEKQFEKDGIFETFIERRMVEPFESL